MRALVLLAIVSLALAINDAWMTVYYDKSTDTYSAVNGEDSVNGYAWGMFADDAEVTGWGELFLWTNPTFPDNNTMYAAGFLEGVLTAHRIYQMHLSIEQYFFGNGSASTELLDFVAQNQAWVDSQVASNSSDYWQHVGLITSQMNGLLSGYNSVAEKGQEFDLFTMQLLTATGDFLDLMNVVKAPEERTRWMELEPWQVEKEMLWYSHCSSLVKVKDDLSDLFVAHVAWFTFASMNRIFKHYNFTLQQPATRSNLISFSSYPGFLVSLDDFYLNSAGLWVTETTNSILNTTLYDLVVPQTVLSWTRNTVANRLATSGAEWYSYYAMYQSGTYNNQWIVVDWKHFEPMVAVNPGTITIIEQIPGTIASQDVSDYLARGYWPSYNVPFITEIYDKSGYPPFVAKYGKTYSYQYAPRANIFRRDNHKVQSVDTMKTMIRYNDWQNDPFSTGSPCGAIACRYDLAPPAIRMPFGGVDGKISSYKLAQQNMAEVISGPTAVQQPVFRWDEFDGAFNTTLHEGQPNAYKFPWKRMYSSPAN